MNKKCPICDNIASDSDNYPFCSKKCRNIDLLRWLKGDYFIPEDDDDNEKDS